MQSTARRTHTKFLTPDAIAGISTSFLIHLIFLFCFVFSKPAQYEDLYTYTDVTYEAPKQEKQPEKATQMVSQPQKSDEKNDQFKKYLSEAETSAVKEQVQRGNEGSSVPSKMPSRQPAAANQPQPSRAADQPNQPKPAVNTSRAVQPARTLQQSEEQKEPSKLADRNKPDQDESKQPDNRNSGNSRSAAAPKSIKSLTLDQNALIALNNRMDKDDESNQSQQGKSKDQTSSRQAQNNPLSSLSTRPKSLADIQPFSRPSGSGAQFYGAAGTTDFLPNLPDGDITMLNAKADHFAVFVRRVATRVFAQLRSSGWEDLSASEISSLNSFTTITAELSLSGELLKVTLESPSGSSRFDQVVTTSVKKGARDPHPPAEAVSPNGNIKFIFKSRSWAAGGVSARSGAPIERRWLLLGVGLE